MSYFVATVEIVFGILSPIVLVIVLYSVALIYRDYVDMRKAKHQKEVENIRKQPTFDDVEISQPPNDKMFTLRIIKNKEVIFEGSYDKERDDE